jgi:hypothetical protein
MAKCNPFLVKLYEAILFEFNLFSPNVISVNPAIIR